MAKVPRKECGGACIVLDRGDGQSCVREGARVEAQARREVDNPSGPGPAQKVGAPCRDIAPRALL